jgi:predicted outer membrane repeat protein
MKIKALVSFIAGVSLLIGVIAAPFSSQAALAAGSVSGTVSYAGSHDPNHEVLVAAHLNTNSEPVAVVHISGPGDYSLANLPDGSYYISAFLDLNDSGEGPADSAEPFGWYDLNGDDNPDPVTISGGNITGIDITLTDVEIAIQGTACYLGGLQGTGTMQVALHVNPSDPPVVSQVVSLPCTEYFIGDGPHGTYYVSLFYDLNDSGGPPEAGEPFGWYDLAGDGSPDPVVYAGSVITDVNITIGKTHFVDFSATGKDDGTSWQDAFRDVQDALAAANPGEEIWVAAGIYTPGITREASFELQRGVAVYGGFSGSETYRNQRNWRVNTTLLSGEIGDPGTKTDNVYHVVTTASTQLNPVDETTILDGFTISGGYADSYDYPRDLGGGFLNIYGYPTLVNLNFIDNYAYNQGGAIATRNNDTEPLTVVNSTFSGNSATNNAGGIANLSRLVVINSSFVGNLGSNGGGIVGLLGTHTEVYNSIFWDNQGNDITLQGSATATVTYSIVEGGFPSGTHILTGNPLLVDADGPDGIYGTLDDDLHLQADSPAIDAGDNTHMVKDAADSNGNGNIDELIPVDMDGGPRFIDDPATPDTGNGTAPLVEMGADEVSAPLAIGGLQIASSNPTQLGEATIFAARVLSGTQVSYAWDFGDSSGGSNSVTSHTYTTPGVYQVMLTATNSLGSQQTTAKVTVGESLTIIPGASAATGDGALTIEIPSVFTNTVTFSYTPQAGPSSTPGIYEFAGLAFELQAVDEGGNPIIELQTPFTITIHYTESDLSSSTDESTLNLYRYDEGSGQWLALTVLSRDPANDNLTVQLDHFSEFALFNELVQTEQKIYLPLIQR